MQEIAIKDIVIGKRIREELEDSIQPIEILADSIEKIGLLQPIVLDRNKKLIAGYRRIEAMKILERKTIPYVVADGIDDAVQHLTAERDENVWRKPFTIKEADSFLELLRELERPKAEARKKATQAKKGEKVGSKQGAGNISCALNKGETCDKVGVIDPHLKNGKEKTGAGNISCTNEKGRVNDIIAPVVGLSPTSIKRMDAVKKFVTENSDKYPELKEVLDEMYRTENIHKAYRAIQEYKKKTKKPEFDAESFTESQSAKIRKVFAKCPPEGVKLVKGILTSLSREDHETWLHK